MFLYSEEVCILLQKRSKCLKEMTNNLDSDGKKIFTVIRKRALNSIKIHMGSQIYVQKYEILQSSKTKHFYNCLISNTCKSYLNLTIMCSFYSKVI